MTAMGELKEALVSGIRQYFSDNGVEKAVIGLSGGVDSAVAAYLAVEALGKDNVAAVFMPDRTVTSSRSMEDAAEVVKRLGIRSLVKPIDMAVEGITEGLETSGSPNEKLSLANAKARARMAILFYLANLENALVIGTSDKSELALGYTTKYGDSASDILAIGDLWKTDVLKLGKHLGVPQTILKKKPGAELLPGVTAEKELGAPYSRLDRILKLYIEEDLSAEDIIKRGFDRRLVKQTLRRVDKNEHKRRNPVLIKVSKRSFHNREWRMPVTDNSPE